MAQSDPARGAPDIAHMHTLKVDNLLFATSAERVRELFTPHGEVGDVYLPKNHKTQQPRGFAFVRFLVKEEAEAAMKAVDGTELEGRELRVQFAERPRAQNPKEAFQNAQAAPRRSRSRSPPRSRDYDRSREPRDYAESRESRDYDRSRESRDYDYGDYPQPRADSREYDRRDYDRRDYDRRDRSRSRDRPRDCYHRDPDAAPFVVR